MKIAAVVIGRNEGQRLLSCLDSLKGVEPLIYVDSGSTDNSVSEAEKRGATVVSLDMSKPFTAARARNEGLAQLGDDVDYVQFVDGDCEVQPGWIEAARAHLDAHPKAAVVCGRRRERFPEASIYNWLTDQEWDTPLGEARECGGDALMRVSAIRAEGGYDPSLIAGEEPELCVRLRKAGWQIWRIDAEMTLHDANMTRFKQWWKRTRRCGHAFAEGSFMHGAPPERHGVTQTRRALVWGAGVPVLALIGLLFTPWALLVFLAWPLQVLRIALKGKDLREAFFLTLGKLPEAAGVIDFHMRRVSGRRSALIEYK